MYQGSRRKAVVEGAVRQKVMRLGKRADLGLAIPVVKSKTQAARAAWVSCIRASATQTISNQSHRPRRLAIQRSRNPLCKAGRRRQAPKLSAPARSIAAMLTTEHAAEDDEVAAGQRLAARFVRRPEEETRAPSGKSVAPYIAARSVRSARGWRGRGLFPDAEGTSAQAGTGYVAASFAASMKRARGHTRGRPRLACWRKNRAVRRVPVPRAGPRPWRLSGRLQVPGAAAPREKMDEPKLEQLGATGFSTTTTGEK